VGDAKTGIILDCNPAAEKLMGKNRGEIVGQHQSSFHPKAILINGLSPTFREHRHGGPNLLTEDKIITSSGEIRDVMISGSVAEWGGRTVIQGIFRDITEQKLAGARLFESEERHRALFQLSRDALMVLYPPSWTFTDANPSTVEMFGSATKAAFCARASWEVSPERQPDGRLSAEKAKEMIDMAVLVGVSHFDWMHMNFAGRQFPCVVTLMRMESAGKQFLQARVRDVTDLKNAERKAAMAQTQLLHSEKLASIGTLAAGVAHEINNPLTIVAGMSAILDKRMKKVVATESLPELLTLLDKLRAAADRIGKIVNGLRQYARLDTEDISKVDLHKAIDDTLNLIRPIYSKGGLSIETDFASAGGVIDGNGGKLQQVLVNLLSNSKDATEGRADALIRIETADEGESVVLRFSDNGSGIAPHHLATIFDAFFTTKDPGKGTGLGLSISHAIIESFGGTISVESEIGKGTTFIIRLVAADVDKPEGE
jgi:PAS domain S-box-containing protein